jgi:hypothetical protein
LRTRNPSVEATRVTRQLLIACAIGYSRLGKRVAHPTFLVRLLARQYGITVSPDFISSAIDDVLDEVLD